MKNNIAALLILLPLSTSALATNASITKNDSPNNIYGTAPSFSYAIFSTTSGNFPSGTLNKIKTLTSVQYTWYHYINGATDKVEICYDTPYQAYHQYCTDVTASQTGSTTFFNSYQFDNGSTFYIRHTISGINSPKNPSRTQDKIIMNYFYN